MAKVNKIDSNQTGASYCEELTLGVLDPTPANQIWKPIEPNSYKDFGGAVTTVARNPINSGRQRKKGVVTSVDASGGYATDITQTNLQDLLQGFCFASFRRKHEEVPTSATALTKKYAKATSALHVGSLIFVTGFVNSTNNGLKRVTAVDATDITVAETLVDEAAPAAAKIVEVGFQFTTGDATVDGIGGSLPALVTVAKDMTQFGLIPGEFVYIGDDSNAAFSFATAADNGFARVRAVTATSMTFDKTEGTMANDAAAAKTIRIFYGRVLKNEVGTNIVRRSYRFERKLGFNSDADRTKEQADYLIAAIPNEMTMTIPTAEKVTCELSFVALDSATLDENNSDTLLTKVGGVVNQALVEADAFNTSSDVSRIKLAVHTEGTPNPTPLFAFVQELTLVVNNNLSPNKAIGVTGAFEVSAGTFEVGGKLTAYFADVAAVKAVRDNLDMTLDAHFVKANAGFSFDLPLLSLGDGRPAVEQDKPITIPLDNNAATGAKVHPTLNHTLMLVFWDYLPSVAAL